MEKEIKIKDKNCLNCAVLFNCPEALGYSCRKWQKREPENLTKNLIELDMKLREVIKGLERITITKECDKTLQKLIPKTEEDKPSISRRNKKIIKLVEEGKTIEEIATKLELKPETVAKELEYLANLGMLKPAK